MSRTRIAVIAAALDIAFVCVFVLIGRRTHAEEGELAGFATALWPFLAALVLGWAASLAWRRAEGFLLPGVIVWGVTLAGGMVFRAASGQGVQWAFVVVAALVLAAMLLGWRALASVLMRQRRAADITAANAGSRA